jgi:hypothetical protein
LQRDSWVEDKPLHKRILPKTKRITRNSRGNGSKRGFSLEHEKLQSEELVILVDLALS